MNKTKQQIAGVIAALWLLFSSSVAFCSSSGTSTTYRMTEHELTRLEQIFSQLETNNKQLSVELKKSKEDLATLNTQLITLKMQSEQAKQSILTAQNSLEKVNQSFEQYAKEVKNKQRKWRVERAILYSAIFYLLVKE